MKREPVMSTITMRASKFDQASKEQLRRVAILFQKASVPTRFQILLTLSEGEKSAGDLCAEVAQSRAAVSQHLAILRHSGIVRARREGQFQYYELTDLGRELAAVADRILELE